MSIKQCLLAFAGFALLGAGCETRDCLKWHTEDVHHASWVQMIPTGKTIIPIVHPAYTSKEAVCDEYGPE